MLRPGRADPVEQLVVAQRVVQKAETHDDVDLVVLSSEDLVHVALHEVVSPGFNAFRGERLAGGVVQPAAALDRRDVRRAGL